MIKNYQGCEKCPLKDCPPVFGSGPSHAKMMIIGEAPGANEVIKQTPFVGVSGQLLRETLTQAGLNDQEIYITNACLCRPPENKTPTPTAILSCNERLLEEIREVGPKKILTVGGSAISALLTPGKSTPITKTHGLGIRWKYVSGGSTKYAYVVPTYHPAGVYRNPDLFRDFAQDIIKWSTHDKPQPEPDLLITVAQTIDDVKAALRKYQQDKVVSCDLETTGFDFLCDSIMSFGLGVVEVTRPTSGSATIIPIELANKCKKEIYNFLTGYEGTLVFHNCKFDLEFLHSWYNKIFYPKHLGDTMLMEYTVDERGSGDGDRAGRGYQALGLKDQARQRYDIPDYHFDFNTFMETPEDERDYNTLYTYHGMDCYCTARLYYDLKVEMQEESPRLFGVLEQILIPGTKAFCKIEREGFPINVPYFKKLSKQFTADLIVLGNRLTELAKKYKVDLENPNSPVKIQRTLAAMKFPSDDTTRDVMLTHIRKRKFPPDVVEFVTTLVTYRQKSKTLGTFIDGLIDRQVGGRVHPDFLMIGADTGRLACRNPNLQNLPVLMGPFIRKGFVSPKGYHLFEVDYSQLELRVVAWTAQDEAMLGVFRRGEDIHRATASRMFHKPPETIDKLERFRAKCVNFGVIYGRGVTSLTEGPEVEHVIAEGGKAWSVPEAQAFLDGFFEGFPQLTQWIDNQHRLVKAQRYIESATGRRRRFPLIVKPTRFLVERQAVNTPIQGFASDICATNLAYLSTVLPKGVEIVSSVHDSIIMIIRDDLINKWCPKIIEIMHTCRAPLQKGVNFDVPLEVGASIGLTWEKMEEYHAPGTKKH